MVKREDLPDTKLSHLAEFFKVFGDSTRLRIISLLEDSELCVNDIAEKLRMNQSAISHQLRMLKQNRLVKQRREGKAVFYSLNDSHVVDIFRQGIEHISETG